MDRRKEEHEEKTPLLPPKKSDKATQEDEEDRQTRNSTGYSKEKTRNTVSVLQLFRFASPEDKIIMCIGTLFSILHGAGMPVLGLVFGSMANVFLGTNSTMNSGNTSSVTEFGGGSSTSDAASKMAYYCFIYAGLGICTLLSAFLQTYCWEVAGASLVFKLRRQFFRQVLRQQISWFDENQTGDLSLNLLDDLERFREAVGQNFSASIQYTSSFVLGLLVGLLTCWQLTLVALALSPLMSLKAAVVGKYVITKMGEEKEKYSKAGCLSVETFSSNRTVAAFGGEKREIAKYKRALTEGLELAKSRIYLQSVGIGFSYFTLFACQGLAFWYGGKLIYAQEATPGSVITVMTSTLTGIFALGHAIPYLSVITIAQSAAERVYKVIDTIPTIDPYGTTGAFPDKVIGKIEFCQVYFSYPARYSMPVLKRLDFTVLPGQTIGLVGTSGSGKSTIVNMLLRFYEPQSGEVLLDGNDINSLNLHWLRNQIGYVSQEPVLFSMTIYENILLGTTKEVTHQDVIDAAKMANVHEFIVSLPQGYNTQITGTKLSGGQKQRIAIARAIISNPKVLLLDEATSALDGKSEAMVQIGLRKAMKGRTTLVIAHRLSTIRDADCIYALKDGLIVESGSHEKLMEKEGLYYDLVMAQSPLENVEETDAYSIASTVESADDYSVSEFEYKQKKRRRTVSVSRRMSISMDTMTGDKAQLLKEVNELKLEVPSIFKILNKGGQWKILLIGALGSVVAGLVRPAHAYFFSEMLIIFTTGGEQLLSATEFLSCVYMILAIGAGIGYFVDVLFVSWAGENLTSKLRLESYTAIIRQQISWYDEDANSPARLSARLARDAPLVNMAAGERLAIALIGITTILSSLSVAFYFGWRLASVLFLAFPALVLSGYVQVTIQAGGQLRDSAYIENAGNMAIECIQSIPTVQALCQEQYFYRKYREYVEPIYMEAKKQGTYFGIALGLSATIIYFVYSGSFWYGARLVDDGLMTQDNIYRVFFSIAFCAVAVSHMTSFIPNFQKARLACALIFNLIDLKSEIDPMSLQGQKPEILGSIEFREVVFSYPARPETKVLQGLSFKVEPGQTLAVVGMSGSGKSTVVSLVERFYDVFSGVVLIDGVDIREINVAHLREHISLVQQEPVLFDTTIRENIAYGYVARNILDPENPTEAEIIQSAKNANIHDFISKLPQGYDTVVGERAVQLSGGQKQRVAIARALIRNPRILLLDEATSALDTESEKVVQEALDKAREGRTCIVIAHRLSTIQNADVIAVVSNGRIIEMGTPEKLMAKRGVYYKITKKQRLQRMDP